MTARQKPEAFDMVQQRAVDAQVLPREWVIYLPRSDLRVFNESPAWLAAAVVGDTALRTRGSRRLAATRYVVGDWGDGLSQPPISWMAGEGDDGVLRLPGLAGEHQLENAAIAATMCQIFLDRHSPVVQDALRELRERQATELRQRDLGQSSVQIVCVSNTPQLLLS